MKSFVVTIDTEGDFRSTPWSWGERTGCFRSVLEGIPLLRRIWDRYGVKPTYLVEGAVLADSAGVDVLQSERRIGAELGVHPHRESCSRYVPDEDVFLRALTWRFVEVMGFAPRSHRAGRFHATTGTWSILAQLGYTADTSVAPGLDLRAAGGLDYRSWVAIPQSINGVLEVPVTVLGRRPYWRMPGWSGYRWLRPSRHTAFQLRQIVDQAAGLPVLNLMLHTMEVVPGCSPYTMTRAGVGRYLDRLEATVAYLLAQSYESMTLQEVAHQWPS